MSSIIDYVKGSSNLGYRDIDLRHADITQLIPTKYAAKHENGTIFHGFLRPINTLQLKNKVGLAYFLHKESYILPFLVKIRIIIDESGEIYMVVMGKVLKDDRPIAFFTGDTIGEMTPSFELILKKDIMPFY